MLNNLTVMLRLETVTTLAATLDIHAVTCYICGWLIFPFSIKQEEQHYAPFVIPICMCTVIRLHIFRTKNAQC